MDRDFFSIWAVNDRGIAFGQNDDQMKTSPTSSAVVLLATVQLLCIAATYVLSIWLGRFAGTSHVREPAARRSGEPCTLEYVNPLKALGSLHI